MLWLIKGLGAGGAERLLVDALPFIDRTRFNYEIAYMLPSKDDFVDALEAGGVKTHCLNLKGSFDFGVVNRLRRLLIRHSISVLHSHLPFAGIAGRIAGKLAHVDAVVYTEHNVLNCYNPIISLADRLTYRVDDATVAVSDGVAQSAEWLPVLRPRNLSVVANGVSVGADEQSSSTVEQIKESLGIPSDHFVMGNVAHIRSEKGHEHLIDAVGEIVKKEPKVTCVIVGREKVEGTTEQLLERARALGVEKNVIFTGFRTDARDIARTFDVFVLSSLFEGLPIALLESMSLGTPAVVTAVGGVPEAITDGVEGFLVEPKDPGAIADGIVRLVQNPDLRTQFGESAREKVERQFGMGRMVGAVERIYTDVLMHKGIGVPSSKDVVTTVAAADR